MCHVFNILTSGKWVCKNHPLKPDFVTYGNCWAVQNSFMSTVFVLPVVGGQILRGWMRACSLRLKAEFGTGDGI